MDKAVSRTTTEYDVDGDEEDDGYSNDLEPMQRGPSQKHSLKRRHPYRNRDRNSSNFNQSSRHYGSSDQRNGSSRRSSSQRGRDGYDGGANRRRKQELKSRSRRRGARSTKHEGGSNISLNHADSATAGLSEAQELL